MARTPSRTERAPWQIIRKGFSEWTNGRHYIPAPLKSRRLWDVILNERQSYTEIHRESRMKLHNSFGCGRLPDLYISSPYLVLTLRQDPVGKSSPILS